MPKKILYILVIFLLIGDLYFSFSQFQQQTLDGDIARCILPDDNIQPIFENPLGIQTILQHKTYVNPNRFFCHWAFKTYMRRIPLYLQNFCTPIESVYMATALFKTILQIILILLLAAAATGTTKVYKLKFLLTCLLITPFFQTDGYRSYMGIIDPSITYTFFYAFPTAILLLYMLPYVFQFYHGQSIQPPAWIKWCWIPFALVVCLSGPLNPGVIITYTFLFIVSLVIAPSFPNLQPIQSPTKENTIRTRSKWHGFYLIPVLLLSMYSLYLGTFNSQTIESPLPLSEMYARLPKGVYNQFTQKLGFPLLFLMLIVYTILIKKYFLNEEGKKIIALSKWIVLFSICYIFLLPLGGYRDYRPDILRYDTIIPITLSLIFLFAVATLFIFEQLLPPYKWYFISLPFILLVVFTNADKPIMGDNLCEKAALQQIATTEDSVVMLHTECPVMEWRKIETPQQSFLNAQILKEWNITKSTTLYYQE